MSENLYQFADWIGMESLRNLVNRLEIASKFDTSYNKEFTREFAVGETVRVKLPQRFVVGDGIAYQPQPINRVFTTVAVDQFCPIHFDFDSIEEALKLERGGAAFKKEYIEPAMLQLAQEIDSRAALFAYQNTNNIVGQLAVDPTDTSLAGSARQVLIENACTPGEKILCTSPAAMTKIVNGSTTIFNPPSDISKQWREGAVGRARGFDWYESMSLFAHTAGSPTNTDAVNQAGQSGSQIQITATAAGTYKKGDVVSFAGVNNVNPKTRRSTGQLKKFVVTADLTCVGGGGDLLNISPALVGPGGAGVLGNQYQNVDNLPGAGALITFWPGTTTPNGKVGTQGLVIGENAFALVGVKLQLPQMVEMKSQVRDPESGIAIRFTQTWDPILSRKICRFECLFGFGALYPDNCAVRFVSA